jgi:cell division protein FtsL
VSPRTIDAFASLVLAASVVGSGVWVVKAKHEARSLFAELQELEREHDRLQIDWGRLQIEQSMRATHSRIESLARERLDLDEPSDAQVRIVVEPTP